jgi:hypothetical protein
MSCPYFYPVEPQSGDSAPQSAMLPLGDSWAGTCRAVPGQECAPDPDAVRPLCQLGYARGACSRFRADDPGPDAVRFSLRDDDGKLLRLYFVLERDHHPFAHGPLEYSIAALRFVGPPADPILLRQAEAFVASFLKWKRRSAAANA